MFRRAPLVAVTIVTMVALGLGLVAMVFTFLNLALFRVDNVRNPGELAGIERPREAGSEELVPTTRAQFEALRRETAVFSDAFGIVRGNSTRVDGRVMSAHLVTGNFFQVLGVEATHGRTLMPDDDRVGASHAVVVLSHAGWLRRFEGSPAVVGKAVRINGFQYEIVGIAPEGFRGLAIGAPDFWAPAALAGHFRPEFAGREGDIPVDVIGRLKPGMSMESGAAGLVPWATGLRDKPATDRPAPVRLEPRQGTVADDTSEVLIAFAPLFLVFGLVLLIPCANVTNLLLARGVARQREMGIRLSIGATRPRIVRQLLTESLILALFAAAGGFIVSRVGFSVAIYALQATLPLEIAETVGVAVPPADWRVILFLVGGAATATMFFGLTPALRASRVELVRAMRGEIMRDARPGRTRNRLITAQVGASALLLVSAMVLLRGAFAAALVDPGLRTHDTVTIEIPNEPIRAAVVGAIAGHPSVTAVAASLPGPLSSPGQATGRTTDSEGSSSVRSATAAYRYVSASYFAVLDIPVVRGRGFTEAERSTATGVVVVSETLSRTLWPDGGAIGRTISFDTGRSANRDSDRATPLSNRTFTVIGIVRDVPGFSFADWPLAVAYLPTASEQPGTVLTARVNGDPDSVRAALFDRLSTVDPAITRIATLRVAAGMGAYLLGIAFWVAVVLGGLALLLTVVGLFSVLSYLVEEREKEIGVRLALGAPPASITRLVQSQMMRPVAFGLAGGGGLAAALAVAVLASPLGSELAKHLQVLDPIAYVTSLTCIIVACLTAGWVPARRAARIDPIETLRRE